MMNLSAFATYLNILYTDDVYLFQPASSGDAVYGSAEQGWQRAGPFKGNVQQYTGDLAFKEYGMYTNCKVRVFLPTSVDADVGWGVAFCDTQTPELLVRWAPQNKTYLLLLAGTR